LFVGACILALIFVIDVCLLLLSGNGSERRDFISYWAAGQQLVHHQNPYDADAILRLERTFGFPPASQALIIRNPPSALLLVAPLGFVGFRAAALIWSLLLLACWIASVRLLATLLPHSNRRFSVLGYSLSPQLVPLLFAPALACIFFGQTALFALLGLALFLRFHRALPFLAGLCLWLCALKPHLFLPFAAVLILWIAMTRSYAVLAGAILAIGTSSAAALLFDPAVWSQYAHMMRTTGIEREFIPCIAIAFRFAVNPASTWLQYIPASLGISWAVWYYWSRRSRWVWLRHGPLLMLISMLVSPYGWLTDQALALPALLLVTYRASFRSLLVLALASSAIEIGILGNISMHSPFYLWTAPAWLTWYLYATRDANEVARTIPAVTSVLETD
jgi:hypothetical protein